MKGFSVFGDDNLHGNMLCAFPFLDIERIFPSSVLFVNINILWQREADFAHGLKNSKTLTVCRSHRKESQTQMTDTKGLDEPSTIAVFARAAIYRLRQVSSKLTEYRSLKTYLCQIGLCQVIEKLKIRLMT